MHEPLAVRASTKRLLTKDLVFVVDADDAARNDLEQLLGSVDLKVMLFRSAGEFLGCAIPDGPSCLVVEFCMPEGNGLQFQEQLAKAAFQIPLIFITREASIPTAVQAMKAGAVDFLTKPVAEQDLLDAIFVGLARDRMRRRQQEALRALQARFKSLSAREREVLFRVAAGQLNKQIEADLGISEIMVKVHRSHGMRKMNANSVAELVRMSDSLQSGFCNAQNGRDETPFPPHLVGHR